MEYSFTVILWGGNKQHMKSTIKFTRIIRIIFCFFLVQYVIPFELIVTNIIQGGKIISMLNIVVY